MKYRGLALVTAVAMTASLFAIPIHAEDTAIKVTEVDVDGVDISFLNGSTPTFTGTIAIKTDNDTAFTFSKVNEEWGQFTAERTTNSLHLSEVGVALESGQSVTDSKGNTIPSFDKIVDPYYYSYTIAGIADVKTGYTFDTYNSNKDTATPKQILLKVNGVECKKATLSITASGTASSYLFHVSINPYPVTYVDGSMFRLYNPNTGEHFYTSSEEERDIDVAAGWNYEGVGWIAPTSGTPVMRMYNPVAGEHHYTTNKDEVDNLVAAGWNLESDCAWYSAPAETGYPVYREYNPNQFAWNHNYTPSQDENDLLVKAGWQFEGVAWYAAGL